MRTRSEQKAAIRADQQLWRGLAAEVTPARYTEPGPMGEWSFADMAGHLTGWRNRTIARLEAFGRGEPDPPNPWPAELDDAGDDRINDWIHAQHAGRPPEQLVGDYDASYDRLIAALESVPEGKLNDPNALPWLEGAAIVEVDFTGHLHDEHLPSVRTWLDQR
jgi:DinB superfamily